jgi:alkaline phosphatase
MFAHRTRFIASNRTSAMDLKRLAQQPTVVLLLLLLCACQASTGIKATASPPVLAPRRVIFIVADGAGAAHWSLLPVVRRSRTLADFPVTGQVLPRGTSPRVIDSAAAATAYAIGLASFNGAIGVGPDSAAHETILEAAEKAGMATGLVTTTTVTDATPAAFGAHVPDRELHEEIAAQLATSGVDVLMGDGLGYFDGTLRADSQNLLLRLARDYTIVRSPAELARLDGQHTAALIGLFTVSRSPALDPAKPRLATMTEAALAILSRNRNGFFLLVETEGSDEAAHANAPIGEVVEIMADLDRAIQVALRYQQQHPETLIVMTSDHETGGAALHTARGNVHSLVYTTTGHTATLVPLFAAGPGAARFAGVHEGPALGRLLRAAVLGPGQVSHAVGR